MRLRYQSLALPTMALLGVIVVASGAAGYLILASGPKLPSQDTTTTAADLTIWENSCSVTLPAGFSHCVDATHATSLPTSFNLSAVTKNQYGTYKSVNDYFFGVVLQRGEVVVISANASAPFNFRIYQDNRSGYAIWQMKTRANQSLVNEVYSYGHLILNSTNVASYNQQFHASEGALYIFELTVSNPEPISSLKFDIRPA